MPVVNGFCKEIKSRAVSGAVSRLFVCTARLHSLHIKLFPFCPRCLSQSAAKMIKESMDKKFGSSWHVVIGEGFGFEVTHEVKNLLYMFFGGSLAVCVWKCS